MKEKIFWITMWYVGLICIIASIIMWLVTLFMPYRYNYECLGTLKSVQDSTFIVVNNTTHEVNAYTHKYEYVTFDGVERTQYTDGGTFNSFARTEMKDNDWHFMYVYRWWTFHVWYLLLSIVLFFILGPSASAMKCAKYEVKAELEDRRKAKERANKAKIKIKDPHIIR